MTTRIQLSELVEAYDWASTVGPYDNAAYVTRATGRIWLLSDMDDAGEEPPDDIHDDALYLPVPRQSELDIDRDLALRFAQDHLPDLQNEVRDIFKKSGAYARFRNLVDGAGQLDAWNAYRAKGVEDALCAWAAKNGVEVASPGPG